MTKLMRSFTEETIGLLSPGSRSKDRKSKKSQGSWGTRDSRDSKTNFSSARFYLEISKMDVRAALDEMKSSAQGLTWDDAQLRLDNHGSNTIVHEHKMSWHIQLLKTFENPFIILLIILATISYATADFAAAVIIATMVLLSVIVTFFQEYRSNLAAEKLRALVKTTVSVYRKLIWEEQMEAARANGIKDGPLFQKILPVFVNQAREIPIDTLVPGDVVQLSAGDMIPADLRLISSKDLFVSEAPLTGESIPVEKISGPNNGNGSGAYEFSNDGSNDTFLQRKNLCFMGTNVVSGTAVALVVKTGRTTYFGSLARSIVGQRVQTSFDKGIHRFTWLMLKFMMVMVPLVFVINGLAKGNWVEAFMFSLAVAVGMTPEMLPMIISVNLAKGALSMSKKKVIVKRLNSIQNFGAMDVLCTDKTGTLTQDKVILEKYVGIDGDPDTHVLKLAYLNSYYQTGLKNLLDQAILKHAEMSESLKVEKNYSKIDEIPFDFARKRMSVVVSEGSNRELLICKGALEEVLAVSSEVELNGRIFSLSQSLSEMIQETARLLHRDGLRVIAIAYKNLPTTVKSYQVEDESNLIFLGLIAFLDPPKESAAPAIQALNRYGVAVKVLTGDNDTVARKVCKDVNMPVDKILLGQEIESMSDRDLAEKVESVHVFAKLTPTHKERIIRALHSKGHVVGFLGDGINDSPALRAADVGISVENAVDIAKESADIILLEKNLLILEEGVLEGRKVFGNIVKYIRMGASSNFGNVLSVLGASLFLPFLPMLPVQLLSQNLLYDLSQTSIPFDRVDEEYLKKPRRWQIDHIGRFMLCMGPVSSLFDYVTFAVLWFVFQANTPANASLFQSGWFIEGLASQTLIVHMIRTHKIPFLQSRPSWPLAIMTLAVTIAGILLPFSSIGEQMGFQALPWTYFPWLLVVLCCYTLTVHRAKSWFFARFGLN